MELTIVIVSWNVRELLRRCLNSLPSLNPDVETIVVDCDSGDSSAEMVSAEFSWARLIRAGSNVGFSRGNNLALKQSRGSFWLLLNPDAELRVGALEALQEAARRNPRAAVIGPMLLNSDGSLQPSMRRFPTRICAFLESTPLEWRLPNLGAIQRYRCADLDPGQSQSVDWLVGACLFVRAEAAGRVGLLDERFFMYSEEKDWCHRFRDAGWEVIYEPQAQVVHHSGKSSEQTGPNRDILFNRSKIAYFRKYEGRWFALVLRAYLLLGFLFATLEECAKWLVGHKRALRRQRISRGLRVIASGL